MKPQPRYQPGDRIGGRYQVHKALMGGMGEVYLCLDLEEMVPLALKTFQQRYINDALYLRSALDHEVLTWMALESHPNIVRCLWMDTLENQPFIFLEWIVGEEGKGIDLRSWLRRGSIELKTMLKIAIDICHGLIYAQEKQPGLVHRDLKPENILMAQGELAKITDFGLAQIVANAGLQNPYVISTTNERQSLVGIKGIAGTPAYMAPEQWRGETLDERTDIYALGCILYEMLTGRTPFAVDFTLTTPKQMAMWLHSIQAAHETKPCPNLPNTFMLEVDDLLQRCLAKNPSARPANLVMMVSQLTQLYQQHFGQLPPRPASNTYTAIDHINRGVTYADLQQYEKALADYDRAIALDPNLSQAYINRAGLYNDTQAYEQALVDYHRAIELNPNDAKAYNNRGITYYNIHCYDLALTDFSRAAELEPNFASVYSNRGATYADLQQYEQALIDYNLSIELDPCNTKVYSNRGNTYATLQHYDLALADYDRAIELDPYNAISYANRGDTNDKLHKYERALMDYSMAIKLDPNYAKAYAKRGSTHKTMQAYKLALEDYRQAIELEPDLALNYYNRGVIYDALHQHEQALADYGRVIALDPSNVEAYVNRGVIHAKIKLYEQALTDFKRAIEIEPSLAQAYFCVGSLFGNQGRVEEALPYFEQAARLGDLQGALYAVRVRMILDKGQETQTDIIAQVFTAFQLANSVDDMRQVTACFPFLIQPASITAAEQLIEQTDPAELPNFKQRINWLRQIAEGQTK